MGRKHALILSAVLLLLLLPAGWAAAYYHDDNDDTVAPVTRINTADGTILSQPTGMTVSGTTTDEGGSGVYTVLVQLCSLRDATDCVSGESSSDCYSLCPASYDWRLTVSGVESGGYTLSARAMDAADNEEQTGASIRVMVDQSAPATELATGDGSVAIPGQGTIQGKSSDDASGVSRVVVEFCSAGTSTDCKTTETAADCSAGCPLAYRWAAPVPGDLVPGDYQVTAHAFDRAGYEEDGGPSILVKVDGTPPATTFKTADGSFLVATQDKIEGTSTDDASGAAKALVDFCLNGDPENCKTLEAVADCPSACPVSYDWAILLPAELTPGPYQVTARAIDRVGNEEKNPPFINVFIF